MGRLVALELSSLICSEGVLLHTYLAIKPHI